MSVLEIESRFIAAAIKSIQRNIYSDILHMSPWNGANASILPGSEEAMGGRHSFPGASAAPTVQSDV